MLEKKNNHDRKFRIATDAMNIYQRALELASFDISKFSSQYTIVSKDTILDFYIQEAKKELKNEGKYFEEERYRRRR